MSYFSEVIELYKNHYNSLPQAQYVEAFKRGETTLKEKLGKGRSASDYCKAQLFSLLEDALDYRHRDVMQRLVSCIEYINKKNNVANESEENRTDFIPAEPFKYYSKHTVKLVKDYNAKDLEGFYQLYNYAYKYALPNLLKRLIAYEKTYRNTHSEIEFEAEFKRAKNGQWRENLGRIIKNPFPLARLANVKKMGRGLLKNFKGKLTGNHNKDHYIKVLAAHIKSKSDHSHGNEKAISSKTTTSSSTATLTTSTSTTTITKRLKNGKMNNSEADSKPPKVPTPIPLEKQPSTASESKSHVSPTPEENRFSGDAEVMLVEFPATKTHSASNNDNNNSSANSLNDCSSFDSITKAQPWGETPPSDTPGEGTTRGYMQLNLMCRENSFDSLSQGSSGNDKNGARKRPATTDANDDAEETEKRPVKRPNF